MPRIGIVAAAATSAERRARTGVALSFIACIRSGSTARARARRPRDFAATTGPFVGQDKPLAAVDQLSNRVQMSGVHGSFGDDVQHRLLQIVEPPIGPAFRRPVRRWVVERCCIDDRVGTVDLLFDKDATGVRGHAGWHYPGDDNAVVARDVLAGENVSEPEPFDVESKVMYQAEAGPLRGKHGTPEVVIGKTLQDPEDWSRWFVSAERSDAF